MSEARISAFFYCAGFEQRFVPMNNNAQVAPMQVPLDILNNISPPLIPTTFSFAFGVAIAGFDLEANNVFEYQFVSPSGETILTQTAPISAHAVGPKLDIDLQGIVLNLQLQNVMFKEEGFHVSKIFLNHIMLGEYPILVKVNKAVVENV